MSKVTGVNEKEPSAQSTGIARAEVWSRGYIFIETFKLVIYIWKYCRRVTRWGRGRGLPCPFSKIGKKCPNLGKNTLIAVFYRSNFSFKMQFLRVSRQKHRWLFPCRAFLSCVVGESLWRCLFPRKLPCPKKFLVTRLVTGTMR